MRLGKYSDRGRLVLQDLDLLARGDDFLVGQAVRLSPPAGAGVWLRLCCFVGQVGNLRRVGNPPAEAFKTRRGSGTSYELRGGSGSWREITTTGRVFAASPRSANQTSPGGLIDQVQYLLFGRSRPNYVENILISEIDDFGNALRERRFPASTGAIWRQAFLVARPFCTLFFS